MYVLFFCFASLYSVQRNYDILNGQILTHFFFLNWAVISNIMNDGRHFKYSVEYILLILSRALSYNVVCIYRHAKL